VLVANGAISLAWMLLLTLIDVAEKALPMGRHTARTVGVAFLVLRIMVETGRVTMSWVA
jgi:predicted metal-binding membrane protein